MIETRKSKFCKCGEKLQEYYKKYHGWKDNSGQIWIYKIYKRCLECLEVFTETIEEKY